VESVKISYYCKFYKLRLGEKMKNFSWLVVVVLVLAIVLTSIGCRQAAPAPEQPAPAEEPSAIDESQEAPVETTAPASAYSQSPMLDDMDLPPVEERLPDNPLVIEPYDEIGQYGGTLVRATAAFDEQDGIFNLDINPLAGFFSQPALGEIGIQQNVAESWEWNDEGTELIINLREGIRWSDGEPFTADDVLFFFEDVLADEDAIYPWHWIGTYFDADGNLPIPEKLSDYSVKFTYGENSFIFEAKYASNFLCALPKHHLSQWHPKYNSDSDYGTFNENLLWRNEGGKVVLTAYVMESFSPDSKATMVRNPYFWKVDTQGQQLPYIDRVEVFLVADREAVALGNVLGEFDFDTMWVGFPQLPMFLEEQDQRDFSIGFYNTPSMAILFNFDADNEDTRTVLRDVNFRRALSLAIDRNAISEALFYGQIEPIGSSWSPDSQYFNEQYAYLYSQKDLDEANRILDEADIIDRNGDGIRELPTGEKLEIIWDTYEHDLYAPLSEMVVSQAKEAGINLILNQQAQTLHVENMFAGNFHMSTYDYFYAVEPFFQLDAWIPLDRVENSPLWHPNASVEPFSPEYAEFIELMREGAVSPTEERIEMGREANRIMAENIFKIHIGFGNRPYIHSNSIGNIPLNGSRVFEIGGTPPTFRPEQFFVRQ
jgi:peptide/nickel transport system substrate-binding protein